jgi:hypothetical protein
MWPNKRPFRRAAKWDGVFPIDPSLGELSPETFAEIIAYVKSHRTSAAPFDVVCGGVTAGPDDADGVRRYGDAGVTWWQESVQPDRADRITAGPPRF